MNRISAVSGAAVYYWRAISLFSSLMLKTGAEILVHFNHRNPALGKLLIQHVGNRRGASHETRPRKEKKKKKNVHTEPTAFFFFTAKVTVEYSQHAPPLQNRFPTTMLCYLIWQNKGRLYQTESSVVVYCVFIFRLNPRGVQRG